MKKKLWKLGALLGACCVAVSAHAGPLVTQWSFTLDANWSGAPVFTGGGGTTFSDAAEISWGAAGDMHTVGSGRSGLEITNANSAGLVNTNGLAATTNTITHYNNVVAGGSSTLSTAMLLSTLSLTPTLPAPGPVIGPTAINFAINFSETSNGAPCGFPSTSECDDIFIIGTGSLNNQFDYDGNTYFVSFFESTNNLKALPAATCAAAGAAPNCLGLQTQEGQFTPAIFKFTITSERVVIEVPEPPVLALFALGALGLALARRQCAGGSDQARAG